MRFINTFKIRYRLKNLKKVNEVLNVTHLAEYNQNKRKYKQIKCLK